MSKVSNEEKVDKAIKLIRKLDLKDRRFAPDDVYEGMRDMEVFEIAEKISELANCIYDLREILEGKND